MGGFARQLPFTRNVQLAFAATFLRGLGQGIFAVIFNLYVLALGIGEDVLGTILSAGSYAQALGSIPAGLVMELAGFKRAFVTIYATTGTAQLAQALATHAPLILVGAFVGGLGLAGDMVARPPFLARHTAEHERARAFSWGFIVHSVALAAGGLLGGFLPNLFLGAGSDLALAYRDTLLVGGGLTLAALLPSALITPRPREVPSLRVALRPYLHGIDRLTMQHASTALLVGLSTGIIVPYFNLFFIHYLGVSREFYSMVVVLSIVPNFAAIALGPALARWRGSVAAVTLLRILMLPLFVLMGVSLEPLVVTVAYWAQYAAFVMSQPLNFAFAMNSVRRESQVAASAWLNVTFWLGLASATPVGGWLIAGGNYVLPLYLAGILMAAAALGNHCFFRGLERRPLPG